jgi:phosphoglycolate phosphatase
MPSPLQTVLFDFDYTLADSSTGVIASVNFALQELGLPAASDTVIRQTIGLSLADTFAFIVGESLAADRFAAASQDFDHLFIQQADTIMAESTVILPGVAQTIGTLKGLGFTLGVVSSKFRYRIEQVLEREDLAAQFDVIVGREDVIASKPAPEGLLTAMSQLGSMPDTTCYVGDSTTDAKAAQRIQTPFIAVLTGVTPQSEFAAYPCLKTVSGIAEIPDAIAK